ncbi:MAG: hypothetical protein ACOCW8_00360 [bacterium]
MDKKIILLRANIQKDKSAILQLRNHDEDKWKDNDLVTHVVPGDDIEWRIDDNSIQSIGNVASKRRVTIFSEKPNGPDSNGTWTARVSEVAAPNVEEHYLITYRDKNGNNHTIDPVIKVKIPD